MGLTLRELIQGEQYCGGVWRDGKPSKLKAIAPSGTDAPDPRVRRPELGSDLVLALLTAVEKDPAARPPTGTALARLLHAARTAAPA